MNTAKRSMKFLNASQWFFPSRYYHRTFNSKQFASFLDEMRIGFMGESLYLHVRVGDFAGSAPTSWHVIAYESVELAFRTQVRFQPFVIYVDTIFNHTVEQQKCKHFLQDICVTKLRLESHWRRVITHIRVVVNHVATLTSFGTASNGKYVGNHNDLFIRTEMIGQRIDRHLNRLENIKRAAIDDSHLVEPSSCWKNTVWKYCDRSDIVELKLRQKGGISKYAKCHVVWQTRDQISIHSNFVTSNSSIGLFHTNDNTGLIFANTIVKIREIPFWLQVTWLWQDVCHLFYRHVIKVFVTISNTAFRKNPQIVLLSSQMTVFRPLIVRGIRYSKYRNHRNSPFQTLYLISILTFWCIDAL